MATCRDRLKLEHPEDVLEDSACGAAFCPTKYGYLPMPSYCPDADEKDDSGMDDFERCKKCWDREIPETQEALMCEEITQSRFDELFSSGKLNPNIVYFVKEKKDMSMTENVNIVKEGADIHPDYEAQCKALTDRCCSLERTVKALEIENKALETYIETLEARLAKHEIVVKCVEALTGESLGIE